MEVELTQGKVSYVDEEDFVRTTQFPWQAQKNRTGEIWYAVTQMPSAKTKSGHTTVLMHRWILGLERSEPWVDHRNGNGLDNRKENLRLASGNENAFNRAKESGSSLFKGVTRRKARWIAQIQAYGRKQHLGMFDSELEAALAYDHAAIQLFGEFARTNVSLGLIAAPKA